MPPRVTPGPVQDDACIREAVCIDTRKIMDSCRDRDCVEDLRVYLTASSQQAVSTALSVRARSAELLYVSTDVEEVSFNRGYYSVDLRFFYRITGEAYACMNRPSVFSGLALYTKRVLLCGGSGSAKVFTSGAAPAASLPGSVTALNLPTAVVEAVDPVLLCMRLAEATDACGRDPEGCELPGFIADCFDGALVTDPGVRRVYVTLGQFSIVRLERTAQLLIPAYDYCVPEKECTGCGDDDPCTLFSRIDFPVEEFVPSDCAACPCESGD